MDVKDVLAPNLVNLHLQATTKQTLFEEMSELFLNSGLVTNKSEFISALYQREQESSTGIGFHIAIPHAKSSCVVSPAIAVGRCDGIIDYETLDDEVVKMIFMIAVPESSHDDHLTLLSQLARKFMNQTFREQILQATTTDQLYQAFNIN